VHVTSGWILEKKRSLINTIFNFSIGDLNSASEGTENSTPLRFTIGGVLLFAEHQNKLLKSQLGPLPTLNGILSNVWALGTWLLEATFFVIQADRNGMQNQDGQEYHRRPKQRT